MRWTFLFGLVSSSCAANATIGLLFPISCPCMRGLVTPAKAEGVLYWTIKLLRWASTALLAVDHINTRNASIVGAETLSRIPENWKINYKLANTDFGPTGAMQGLAAWTSCSANSLDRVNALVGVPSSKSAKIISTIADFYNLPVVSFGAIDSDLSDKTMYPTFSRTNPMTRPLFRALVGIIKHFGWSSINILTLDSDRHIGMMSELIAAANEKDISVVSIFRFAKIESTEVAQDSEKLAQAVANLASTMRNSSASSGSLVTVLLAGDRDNLIGVLDHGMQQGIMGEGFVWLNVDDISLPKMIKSFDTPSLRKSIAGFFNMAISPSSQHIADTALNTANRSSMRDEAIDEWGRKLESNSELRCNNGLLPQTHAQCHLPWQDAVFAASSLQEASADAAYFDYAYDAVWAAAIGLAAAAVSKDADADVTSYIRSAEFKGASGVVSFDANGERAPLGLTYNLENIQGPALSGITDTLTQDATWQDFKFEDHVVLLGAYEERSGFVRASAAVPGRVEAAVPGRAVLAGRERPVAGREQAVTGREQSVGGREEAVGGREPPTDAKSIETSCGRLVRGDSLMTSSIGRRSADRSSLFTLLGALGVSVLRSGPFAVLHGSWCFRRSFSCMARAMSLPSRVARALSSAWRLGGTFLTSFSSTGRVRMLTACE